MYKVWADELEENVRFDPKKSTQAWLQPPLILIKGSHTKQAMQEATKWSITCKGPRTGKRSHTLQIPRPLISFQVGGCMKWGWGGKSLALQRHCLFFFFFFLFSIPINTKAIPKQVGGIVASPRATALVKWYFPSIYLLTFFQKIMISQGKHITDGFVGHTLSIYGQSKSFYNHCLHNVAAQNLTFLQALKATRLLITQILYSFDS